ncbi:MAG: aminopeptidase P family N-terminal domain-containing protein, partial [Thermoplasmata archaeon]|nr:aminopeptidase P family N-terminal domain-containing protein [Thermoplasmata archaeon]
MKNRVRRILELVEPRADALLLANAVDPHLDGSFFYTFDVPSGLFEGSVSVGLPDGHLHVLSSPLEEESALQAAKRDPDVDVHVFSWTNREAILKKVVPEKGTLALNFRELTHESFLTLAKLFPEAKWVDASNAIRAARMIKDAQEIERLGEAARIGSAVGR